MQKAAISLIVLASFVMGQVAFAAAPAHRTAPWEVDPAGRSVPLTLYYEAAMTGRTAPNPNCPTRNIVAGGDHAVIIIKDVRTSGGKDGYYSAEFYDRGSTDGQIAAQGWIAAAAVDGLAKSYDGPVQANYKDVAATPLYDPREAADKNEMALMAKCPKMDNSLVDHRAYVVEEVPFRAFDEVPLVLYNPKSVASSGGINSYVMNYHDSILAGDRVHVVAVDHNGFAQVFFTHPWQTGNKVHKGWIYAGALSLTEPPDGVTFDKIYRLPPNPKADN